MINNTIAHEPLLSKPPGLFPADYKNACSAAMKPHHIACSGSYGNDGSLITNWSIKYTKEWALRPLLTLSWMRFQNVQYDTHTIFVIVPDDALVGVSGISFNNAILLGWAFAVIDRDLDRWCTLYRHSHFTFLWVSDWVIDQVLPDLPFLVDYGCDSSFWR